MAQSFIRFSLSWDDSICHIFHVKFSLCRFYTNPLEFEVEKTHQKFQDSVQKLLFGVKNNQISLYNVLISSIEYTEVKSRVFFLKINLCKNKNKLNSDISEELFNRKWFFFHIMSFTFMLKQFQIEACKKNKYIFVCIFNQFRRIGWIFSTSYWITEINWIQIFISILMRFSQRQFSDSLKFILCDYIGVSVRQCDILA